jgi:transposase-like protein
LDIYQQTHGRPLKPVQRHTPDKQVPDHIICPHCNAPAAFLYFNDGKKRQQILCKVCSALFQIGKRFRKPKTKYWCPHCRHALYRWKQRKLVTIYKCDNDNCPAYLSALNKLNEQEKQLRKTKLSQFKLRYQYREYHFTENHLKHSAPDETKIDIDKIHHSANILGLVLTFHISFAITARKTAFILQQVFQIKISYQTVLNYTQAVAPFCHLFNLHFKGQIDDHSAGDETYIKIAGKQAFTFLFISTINHKITAYHVGHSRDTIHATAAMKEAIRTADDKQNISITTDGNPAYPAGIHFLNSDRNPENPIQHHKVVGLQNLDEESEHYRHFKQLIERLNRTYKFHTRPANGFKNHNGAVVLTTLFVTHYNFLRPHLALDYNVPIPLPHLDKINTIQEKWCSIIDIARLISPERNGYSAYSFKTS